MIDNRNTVHFQQPEECALTEPLFDERACANAQPVMPIPNGRFSAFVQRLRNTRPVINAKTRAFTIVTIAGLAVGALGGTLLVNQKPASVDEASVFEEPAREASASEDPVNAPNVATGGALPVTEKKVRPQRRYRRLRVQTLPRAYQVDVIR